MVNIYRNTNFSKRGETGEQIIQRAGDVMKGAPSKQETAESANLRLAASKSGASIPGMMKQAYTGGTVGFGGSSVMTTHPMFYSPIHTPLNWQIPTKRREVYMWCRFFASNNATIKASLRFYSQFPFGGFDNIMRDPVRKEHFDNLKKRLKLEEVILPQIAYEYFCMGDAFPFVSVNCPTCGGWGIDKQGQPCDHKGGEISSVTVLNPDNIDVKINPLNHSQSLITMMPDEVLHSIVIGKQPKPIYDKIPENIRKLIATKQPIPLSPRSIAHLKHDAIGYQTYGFSIIAPLFPVLAYLDRLRQAQWIVAERHILPIKVCKVGNDQRPAGPADIADMQSQLATTANDPNLTIVTHHAFDFQWVGAAGKVLQITKEYELIDKEIIKGLGVNEALLSGQGPSYSQAAIGIEATIKRLKVVQKLLSWWIVEFIYKTEAKMQGFYKMDKFGNQVLDYPEIRWNDLNLRDETQRNNMYVQLWEKGIVSTQFVCEKLGIDYDTEVERVRMEQQYQLQNGISPGGDKKGGGGLGGGFGGGGGGLGGGGGGGLGGNLPGGKDGPGLPGDELAPSMSGGEGMGGGAPSGGASMEADDIQLQISNYEMAKKTKPKIHRPKKYKLRRPKPEKVVLPEPEGQEFYEGPRTALFNLTSIERALYGGIERAQKQGLLSTNFLWQQKPEPARLPRIVVDGIFPDVKLIVQADGEQWHSSDKDIAKDQDIDARLSRFGWNVLRFTDYEIENQIDMVIAKIIQVYKELSPENSQRAAFNRSQVVKIANNEYFQYKVGNLMYASVEDKYRPENIVDQISKTAYQNYARDLFNGEKDENTIVHLSFIKTRDDLWVEENDSSEVEVSKTTYNNLPSDIRDDIESGVIATLDEITIALRENIEVNKEDIVENVKNWYIENVDPPLSTNEDIIEAIVTTSLSALNKGNILNDEE